ncbi:dihydrolipoyl dehydrogenase [Azospirillum palustre]|uniref:Dihydrolipoyl dehydrogenase n=1 Tax=Azospirillum palustre TaxID=2044885 RepID=A0A2B8BMG1_9PROT|nr:MULTISPECIES: dihydrolipoyl dehydrogenase [Azospirillum]MDR6775735.1 dihydrolipoamide dehydrogenase [Azospirillum sp. BE72]PGH58728.1 dihydrolipoyl dehydrogenase [Azospirillum palustre]
MSLHSYDVIIIGGGPGGYVAAIRAAQLGLHTAVVERENLGGICLNWGCIPTKALLRSAEVLRNAKHANDYGLVIQNPGFDLDKVVQRSRKVANQLNNGVKHLLKKNKVTVIEGAAKLAGKGLVAVTKGEAPVGTFGAKHIIIATGARARALPGLEEDGKLVWTYRKAMTPDVTPKSLLVIGSGAIGVEFASFYNELGAKVTVVEVMDRILPVEDEEISAMARKSFEKQGMRIITGGKAGNLRKSADSVTVTVEADGKIEDITVDRIIVAAGISPNTKNLGLEGTKVKLERGHIQTNAMCETDEPGVYAIGDVTGAPWLAHKASHEGVIVAEHIAGKYPHGLNILGIPGCTYSHPQIASVGLTEKKAKEKGYEVKVGRFPFIGNGKAIALGETEGMVKTVFDAKTGELLGAHMIGAEVTELIQGYTVAKTIETTEAELMHTVFPHPTLSEMMHESVLAADNRAIHI